MLNSNRSIFDDRNSCEKWEIQFCWWDMACQGHECLTRILFFISRSVWLLSVDNWRNHRRISFPVCLWFTANLPRSSTSRTAADDEECEIVFLVKIRYTFLTTLKKCARLILRCLYSYFASLPWSFEKQNLTKHLAAAVHSRNTLFLFFFLKNLTIFSWRLVIHFAF